MNFKIMKISLLLLLTSSCGSNSKILNASKYETVYSSTINIEDFKAIHQLLTDNLLEFPKIKNEKINYKKENNKYFLKIHLKKSHFKLVYKSNIGYDDKIESIKSEIKSIIDRT